MQPWLVIEATVLMCQHTPTTAECQVNVGRWWSCAIPLRLDLGYNLSPLSHASSQNTYARLHANFSLHPFCHSLGMVITCALHNSSLGFRMKSLLFIWILILQGAGQLQLPLKNLLSVGVEGAQHPLLVSPNLAGSGLGRQSICSKLI